MNMKAQRVDESNCNITKGPPARSGDKFLCALVPLVPAAGADLGGGDAGGARQVPRGGWPHPLCQGGFLATQKKRIVYSIISQTDVIDHHQTVDGIPDYTSRLQAQLMPKPVIECFKSGKAPFCKSILVRACPCNYSCNQVDCVVEVALCREHHITGFPSIRVFRKVRVLSRMPLASPVFFQTYAAVPCASGGLEPACHFA